MSGGSGIIVPGKECQAMAISEHEEADHQEQQWLQGPPTFLGGQFCCRPLAPLPWLQVLLLLVPTFVFLISEPNISN